MTKKILLLLAMMVSMCCTVSSQNAVGQWISHTCYDAARVSCVAEGRQWVYYLAGEHLFRLDKKTGENEALSIVNELSDMGISRICYNATGDYLVVVYANSNIDIVESDGTVVNMPEIKDAVLTTGKAINDVTFAPGIIYLATEFGYVVIDDKKFVIKESHLYGVAMTSVAQVGQTLLLATSDTFYYGDAREYHEQLSSFKTADFKTNCRLWPIDDHRFFCMTGWTFLGTMNNDETQGETTFSSAAIIESKTTVVQETQGGFLLNVPLLGKYFTTDAAGSGLVEVDSPGEICSSHPDGDGNVWAAGAKGLHQLGNENYYLPNVMSFSSPFWLAFDKSQDLLMVSSTADNGITVKTSSPTAINTYDGGKWTDVTPEGAPSEGSFGISFLPDVPGTYLLSTWRNGLLRIKDGEIVFTYDDTNSPMKRKWSLHPITSVDRNGNVWVVQSYENQEHPVMVLPAAKAKQNQTEASDWVTPAIDGVFGGYTKGATLLSTCNSQYDIKLFADGGFERPLVMWNSAGEIATHYLPVSYNRLNDQDGVTFSWTYILCLTEDMTGMVWMGTSEGICMFNPAQAFSGSAFSVVRPKVPRNDGTDYADRLMDGIQVNDIAVDGANRKWIATQSSGLFLVSPNGDKVIHKFNTTNSPLASNTVYRVCCDPNSNSVYVTTPAGLYEYFSDSSPAEPTYDNIYAYPNPVRPDYLGEVTIKGLMDNSLVKIADASGNVLAQLKSTGGMVTWDCCDQRGERVKSGVYLVLCSQAGGGSSAVVTKIAVIR